MTSAMATIERYTASTVSVVADLARRVLGAHGVIALPTESFYGLGASPFDEQALTKLWQIKGRSEGKPVLILIGDASQLGLLSLIHISEPTRLLSISYAVFCL